MMTDAKRSLSIEGEFRRGERFRFGDNWARFLVSLDESRIAEAGRGLREMLDVDELSGLRFLDVGSGSGLMSLAARRLGARVHSFDYDPRSVACTKELKERYAPNDAGWTIAQGSVLDRSLLRSLGTFDVVYAWGVLHHTGAMWQGLENVIDPVAQGGRLFIAIYNDQGWTSVRWRRVKRLFCSGRTGRAVVCSIFLPWFVLKGASSDLLSRTNPRRRYREYRRSRGMSIFHDWVDWLGGYPFEVAKPEEIFDFYRRRGFTPERLTTCGGRSGCNQFVFRRGVIGTSGSPSHHER